jgi:hypothetical protein
VRVPAISLSAKRRLKKYWWLARRPTAGLRTLPDFIIFGAQKSGTTSLYRYLIGHGQVRRPFGQEPTYFSHEVKWASGVNTYRANFPLEMGMRSTQMMTGEASGEYLYYPAAPERILQVVPNVKLIAVLREPVERTVSHYFHNVKVGSETRTFETAVAEELAWQSDPSLYTEPPHRRFGPWGGPRCYVGRSMYGTHLERWLGTFPNGRVLVIEAEAMYEDPSATFSKVCAFLELDVEGDRSSFGQFNAGKRRPVSDELTGQLRSALGPSSARLGVLLKERSASLHPASDVPRWSVP